jgi:four helix bundle protein
MEQKQNLILDRSFQFAIRIYHLSKLLKDTKKEFYLADQLLRSGTSISANLHEANVGQTRKDFYSKLSIALKEARECEFWIKLLYKVQLINDKEYQSISSDCLIIIKILAKIRSSTKVNSH